MIAKLFRILAHTIPKRGIVYSAPLHLHHPHPRRLERPDVPRGDGEAVGGGDGGDEAVGGADRFAEGPGSCAQVAIGLGGGAVKAEDPAFEQGQDLPVQRGEGAPAEPAGRR